MVPGSPKIRPRLLLSERYPASAIPASGLFFNGLPGTRYTPIAADIRPLSSSAGIQDSAEIGCDEHLPHYFQFNSRFGTRVLQFVPATLPLLTVHTPRSPVQIRVVVFDLAFAAEVKTLSVVRALTWKCRMRQIALLVLIFLSLSATVPCFAKDKTPEGQRAEIRKMANDTLATLYKEKPTARGAISSAAGHAVFDNMGVHVLLLSTARGGGIAVNHKTQKETFMRMRSAGAGLGAGVKDYRVIFVFETAKAFDGFINSGWQGGTQADAAAKSTKSGGAYSGAVAIAPGVWVYQLTKKGIALQLTLQGTKYSKDSKLND
jgi:lipid-binding SYLF domain-containing protein